MIRFSVSVLGRGLGKRFYSSVSIEGALPPNLLLPSNLVDPSRLKRPAPTDTSLPLLRVCDAPLPSHLSPVLAWVDTLQRMDSEPLGVTQLHPDVFGMPPRLDIIYDVEKWQRNYKRISHAKAKTRAEVQGGGRKPWSQKGGGRARHGSIRSPIWKGGGKSHGPRGPTSYYYTLPMKVRVMGLKVTLSSKLTQDCLYVVDSLDLPTPDPKFLQDLIKHKHWGESVLIVDVGEQFPENILQATAQLQTVNLIPALGLNVHSMLKHHTVVLTLETIKFLESKLLLHDQRFSQLYTFRQLYSDFP